MGDKIAYLREYDSKNCDIRFTLLLKTLMGEILEKEIIGFSKVTDSLADLKKNIQQTIIKLGEHNDEKENDVNTALELPDSTDDVKVVFHRKNKSHKETQTLQDFIKHCGTNVLEEQMRVYEQNFAICINAPLIRMIKLPSSICANFKVEPAKLGYFNMDRAASKFNWYKSLDKIKWEKVGEGYQYDVKASDVNHYLKLLILPYSQHKIKGPTAEAISENIVYLIADFPKCPFEDRHTFTKQNSKGNKFRIASYNILADRYVDGSKFPYCPPNALCIHYRKQLFVKEIKGYNLDILCLQEVDSSHYKEYYQEELKKMGYKSIYNRKGNCIPEGLVSAFNRQRYKLLDSKHLILKTAIERKQFTELLTLLNCNAEVKKEFTLQNTSLQTIVLQENKTKNILIIGNTHLFYHPDANHIRLLQAFTATTFLNNLKHRFMREYPKNKVAVIYCGDFNSDLKKSLYDFMIRGTIEPNHMDCLKISPSGDARLYHKFKLKSASGTPTYTNYTQDFKGCLDYIFIENNRLTVDQVVPVPTEAELQKYEGLPNEYFPSDHVALVVDLQFK